MIDHTGIGVADIARSAALYDAALGAPCAGLCSFSITGPMVPALEFTTLFSGLTAFTHME